MFQRSHQPLQHQLSGPPSVANPVSQPFLNGPKACLPSSSASEFQPISSSSNYQHSPHSANSFQQQPNFRNQQTSPLSTYSMMSKPSEANRYGQYSPGGDHGNKNQAMFRNNHNNDENIKGWLSPRENKYARTPSESSFQMPPR